MKLSNELREQLVQYLELLQGPVTLAASVGEDEASQEMWGLLEEVASLSPKIEVRRQALERTPSFRVGERVCFAGVPLGHEFSSFVLALLHASGRKPKVDEQLLQRIESLQGTYDFTTYVSLSCHNCPDVVQALNTLSVLNPRIRHTMVDGALFEDEVRARNVLAVPAVFLADTLFSSGRSTLEELIQQLAGAAAAQVDECFDVLVVGGGPAAASAAIYAARKGIKVAMAAERFGGQVADTLGIENLIGTRQTQGPKLVRDLESHVKDYAVRIFTGQRAKSLVRKDFLEVALEGGTLLQARTVIVATGARWRTLDVPGEARLKNHGVAYCPHCDGPLFKGKRVAVVGGGNSGVEAAIDLAGLVDHVTLLEFGPKLKADQVLQERLQTLPNVAVVFNAQTQEITGQDQVDGLVYLHRTSGQTVHLEVAGVFVQIGLVPNTGWLEGTVERNGFGEVLVDHHGATSLPGVFAAGDCTDVPYKQIVVSLGAGAVAALGAFDHLIRQSP